MNKKFSTLFTVGLLLGGSLFVPADAKEITGEQFLSAIESNSLNKETLDQLLGGEKLVELTTDVNLKSKFSNFPIVIVSDGFDGYTFTAKNGVKFNGKIIVAEDGVTIKDIDFVTPLNAFQESGNAAANSAIVVCADDVTITGNSFVMEDGIEDVTGARTNNSMVGITVLPQSENANYSTISGNTISGFDYLGAGQYYSSGIELLQNTQAGIARGIANTQVGAVDFQNALKALIDNGIKGLNTRNVEGVNSAVLADPENNGIGENNYAGNTVNEIVSNNGSVVSAKLDEVASEAAKVALKDLIVDASANAVISVENATAAEVQAVIAGLGEDVTGNKNLTIVTEDANIIVGEPTNIPDNGKDNVEVTGAFVKMTNGKTYTLYAQGKGYLTVTGTDITYEKTVSSGAYWTVSINGNGVYTFTNALGKKLSYNGFSEFELTETSGNLFTLSANKSDLGEEFGAAEVPMNNVTAADMNAVNEGSFSIDYRFNDQEIAEVNPFKGDVKAFEYKGDIYFASSWPSSLDKENVISNVSDFNKCVFVVATPEHSWNINDVRENGEGTRFAEVQGNRLVVNPSLDELKAGKYAISNAAFFVQQSPLSTNAYTLMLKEVTYLNEDRDGVLTGSNLYIALLDDEAGLIVTTITDLTKTDKVKVSGTITNSRTANVSEILSSDKASIFNIKFVSTTADWTGENDKTKSEYNKYLGVNADGTFAQGAEFLNLSAPENQWIIVNANQSAKTFTFQNRELDGITFTTQLVKTDKANVYELRAVGEWVNEFAYLDKDAKNEYTEGWSFPLSGTTVQLEAVNADPEAGYVTNELDTAGLIRMSFTTVDRVIAGELFVTTDDNGNVVLDQDESKAEQFSVIKFDAAATNTALSDTLYADNDYAIWSANKVQIVPDGDTIAVVSYAFKQLRADGKSYYLNHEFELAKEDDEADAPRFMIKVNKNNSYSLIPVKEWYRWDSYRDNVKQGTTTYAPVETAEEYVTRWNASIYYDYATREFDFNILKETPGTSYEHKPQHVTMQAVNGGYLAMDSVNMDGIVAPVSSLRSSYTKDQLTFKLDTADSEAVTPSFMISHMGNYMYNATDSLNYYNEGTASDELVKKFGVEIDNVYRAKAIFQSADLEKVEDLNNYKFQIVLANDSENEYVIRSVNDYHYVAAHNQKLYFTNKVEDALKVYVEKTDAPTANEEISAGNVVVAGVDGAVVVKGAEGKNVIVSTILGKVVANEVVSSDNATIAAPAGIVVVSVDGESFKVVVK